MAEIKDIKEGAKFKTSTGRIGVAYAVTKKKKEQGLVDLIFEGGGSIVTENQQPCGIFKIESLELI